MDGRGRKLPRRGFFSQSRRGYNPPTGPVISLFSRSASGYAQQPVAPHERLPMTPTLANFTVGGHHLSPFDESTEGLDPTMMVEVSPLNLAASPPSAHTNQLMGSGLSSTPGMAGPVSSIPDLDISNPAAEPMFPYGQQFGNHQHQYYTSGNQRQYYPSGNFPPVSSTLPSTPRHFFQDDQPNSTTISPDTASSHTMAQSPAGCQVQYQSLPMNNTADATTPELAFDGDSSWDRYNTLVAVAVAVRRAEEDPVMNSMLDGLRYHEPDSPEYARSLRYLKEIGLTGAIGNWRRDEVVNKGRSRSGDRAAEAYFGGRNLDPDDENGEGSQSQMASSHLG
ncbi:hypothetical protein TWF730_007469 [Orbilia blumenaviensis]|uniref:Uncharacterized protein n=1 Tax=Orbilia blumenaviensis TaxID=1796055 RepID=A0AAV9VA78_9PEZI